MDKSGCTPLHLAIKYKRGDLIRVLDKLNPECANMDGLTPLHMAAKSGPPEVLKTLIDVFSGSNRRVNIDRRDDSGSSALHLSALVGDEEKVLYSIALYYYISLPHKTLALQGMMIFRHKMVQI